MGNRTPLYSGTKWLSVSGTGVGYDPWPEMRAPAQIFARTN